MSLNVLVVDDSPVMRRMVRRSLGMSGLPVGEIFEAGNGIEALATLGDRWVDVVIADINMPEMSGVEMVERMAADGLIGRVPIVMVSSDRSEERMERLKELGVHAYLTKPFRPEAFRAVVEDLLPICANLKAEPNATLLAEVTAGALEECVFVLARKTESPVEWPASVVHAGMSFDGPVPGRLGLATTFAVGRELAAAMLGVEADDGDAVASVDAALAELTNILCGVLVERLFGREVTCKLGLPEVTHGPLDAHAGGIHATLGDDEGRLFRVTMDMAGTGARLKRGAV
jgi:two-component system chemotaxis response regulator CheY